MLTRGKRGRTEVGDARDAATTLANIEDIEIKNAALALIDMKNFVDADISTAVDQVVPPTGGGRQRRIGGSKTGPALKQLVAGVLNDGSAAVSAADEKFAAMVSSLPTLKQVATGFAVTQAVRHPWFFTDVVRMVRDTLPSLIPEASYSAIFEEVRNSASELVKIAGDQKGYIAGSPLYTMMLATLLVRYLAKQQQQSPMEYLQSQAKYTLSMIGMFYKTASDLASEMYTHVTSDESKKQRILNTLGEAVSKVPRSKVTYEGVGPAAAPGLMVQKPSPADMTAVSAKKLADTLTKIVVTIPDTNEAANILASLANAPPAVEGAMEGVQGGRRRKTKKRVTKKRRVTRRKPTFSY